MLLLIVILTTAFVWTCCIYHHYLQEYVHFILCKNALWDNITEEHAKLVIRKCLTFFYVTRIIYPYDKEKSSKIHKIVK